MSGHLLIPRLGIDQVGDVIAHGLSANRLDDAIDPKDLLEWVPVVMKDGVLYRITSEGEFLLFRRKTVDDPKITAFSRRCIAHLEKCHWLIFKPYFIRKLRVQKVIGIMADRGRLHWRHGVVIDDRPPPCCRSCLCERRLHR